MTKDSFDYVIFSWLLLSIIVGILGSNRSIGFAGAFFLSLLLSPVIGLLFVIFSEKPDPKKVATPEVQKLVTSAIKKIAERRDFDSAIADMTHALRLQPNLCVPHFQLARIYSILEKRQQAYHHLAKAFELGFLHPKLVLESPDFAFIRRDADFDQFVSNGYKFDVPSQAIDQVERLEKLAKLKRDGILTEQEFEEQKRRVLGK